MSKRICLITPGHIASNPRLVKEAMALHTAGMQIHIIFSQYVPYLVDHDQKILESNPAWTYEFIDWTKGSLRSKFSRICSAILQRMLRTPELKLNRNFRWQLKKAISNQADLYIGHNLGALPVAVLAAEGVGAKSGFDAEDFHRHQVTDDINDDDVKLVIEVEEKYIPRLNYLTAAGELIAEAYRGIFDKAVISIANVFPKRANPTMRTEKASILKVFWFSQTIGPRRGLEEAIIGIGLSGVELELHLLGEVTEGYRNQIKAIVTAKAINCTLHFHATMPPDALFLFGEQFDIGLASEPGFSMNNKLALSNKLYSYLLCGLALAASTTIAQTNFIEQYPQVGILYNSPAELAALIKQYNVNRELLANTKMASLDLGQRTLNWENESRKLVNHILALLDFE